ncbi:condensation domain-containing protein [Streptomyces luteogriseus]|uniref:condensation domain-containing protein n=1 Tax=Streptomyces luteogriseus TaxID=68233 RepID=UPI0037AE348C
MRENPKLGMAIWSTYRISGTLDVDLLVDCIKTLVVTHDALRIRIVEGPDGLLHQQVRDVPERESLLAVEKVLSRSEKQFERYVRHVTASEQVRDWKPEEFPFRFRLLEYGPTVHALLAGFSHIAIDGIGSDILMRDLKRLYATSAARGTSAGKPRLSFVKSAARQAAARARRSRGTAAVPALPAVPPLTQFNLQTPPPQGDGARSRQSIFSLSGDELGTLRRLVRLHGCTEFQWILAAFASTVFRFTWQDRLKVSVPVNLRTAADRDVAGMYVLSIPVLIDRPGSRDGFPVFPKAVGAALLRTIATYQKANPERIEAEMATAGERWGARFLEDLSVNYTRSSFSRRSSAQLGWSEYTPQVDYAIRGVGLRVFSFPDALDFHAVLDSAIFSHDSVGDLVGCLRKTLTSATDGWGTASAHLTSGDVTPLRDATGAVVVSANLPEIKKALLRHPLVTAAAVERRMADDGGTYLRAEVEVHDEMTEESVRDYLMTVGSGASRTLAPRVIRVVHGALRGPAIMHPDCGKEELA